MADGQHQAVGGRDEHNAIEPNQYADGVAVQGIKEVGNRHRLYIQCIHAAEELQLLLRILHIDLKLAMVFPAL